MVDVKPTTYIIIPSNLIGQLFIIEGKLIMLTVNQLKQIKLKNSLKIQGYLKRTEFISFFPLFIYGILKYPQKKKEILWIS